MSTRKNADKSEAVDISRPFLAAMLRRSDSALKGMLEQAKKEALASLDVEKEHFQQMVDQKVGYEIDRRTRDYQDLKRQIGASETAFGQKVTSWSPDMAAIGRAADALEALSAFTAEDQSELAV